MEILTYLILGLFLLIVIIGRIYLTKQENKPMSRRSPFNDTPEPEAKLPYRARPSLLTPTELVFYEALRPLVCDHWHLFCKVRMEDILEVQPGLEKKEAYGYRSRIKSRHIDFVLCDKDSLEVLMCIELDDASHLRRKEEKDGVSPIFHVFCPVSPGIAHCSRKPPHQASTGNSRLIHLNSSLGSNHGVGDG